MSNIRNCKTKIRGLVDGPLGKQNGQMISHNQRTIAELEGIIAPTEAETAKVRENGGGSNAKGAMQLNSRPKGLPTGWGARGQAALT